MYTNINSTSPLKHDIPMLDGWMRLARRNQGLVVTPLHWRGPWRLSQWRRSCPILGRGVGCCGFGAMDTSWCGLCDWHIYIKRGHEIWCTRLWHTRIHAGHANDGTVGAVLRIADAILGRVRPMCPMGRRCGKHPFPLGRCAIGHKHGLSRCGMA